jgi:hypothetical protein
LGFAIHWVGRVIFGGDNEPYMAREIMMVFPNRKVYVCSLNIATGKWHDYSDNLINPEMPHLHSYNLKLHGMG